MKEETEEKSGFNYFVFDLETVPDPEFEPPEEGQFPPAQKHCIVAIGVAHLDVRCQRIKSFVRTGLNEGSLLESFSKYAKKYAYNKEAVTTFVTWNGRGFDFPVLVKRSLKHKTPIDWYYRYKSGMRYRYSDKGHIDLMDALADHGASRWYMGLNDAAILCGLPKKTSKGPEVESMVRENRWDDLKRYCLQDVQITSMMLARYLCISGELTSEEVDEADASWEVAEENE